MEMASVGVSSYEPKIGLAGRIFTIQEDFGSMQRRRDRPKGYVHAHIMRRSSSFSCTIWPQSRTGMWLGTLLVVPVAKLRHH